MAPEHPRDFHPAAGHLAGCSTLQEDYHVSPHNPRVTAGPGPDRHGGGLCRGLQFVPTQAATGRASHRSRSAAHARDGLAVLFRVAAASAAILFGLSLTAQSPQPVPPYIVVDGVPAFRVATPVVHDVDTLSDGVILLPFGSAVAGRKIRADYDGWEVTRNRRTVTITDDELKRGAAARDDLAKMLAVGTLFVAPIPAHDDIDPYDRVDAVWFLRARDGRIERIKDLAATRGWLRKTATK